MQMRANVQRRNLLDIMQQSEFDILNQHTWDEYDWFLYSFCLLFFGFMCLCVGWHSHKKCTADQYVPEEEIQQFSTPISESRGPKKYSFAGFNLFGEALEEQDQSIAHQAMSTHTRYATPTMTIPIPNSPMRQSRHSSIASEAELNALALTPISTVYIPAKPSPIHLPVQCVQVEHVQPLPPMMANIDPVQRSSIPKIAMPSKDSKIVPSYNLDGVITTPQTVATPDSAEPSQSHISLEYLRQYSSNSTIVLETSEHRQGSEDLPMSEMKKTRSNTKNTMTLEPPLQIITEETSVQFSDEDKTPSENHEERNKQKNEEFPDFTRDLTPNFARDIAHELVSKEINGEQAK